MPMLRHEDLPPHLRPDREPPRLYEELPLLDELPPPEPNPRGGQPEELPPAEPFMRR
jgi:hypothetical protein